MDILMYSIVYKQTLMIDKENIVSKMFSVPIIYNSRNSFQSKFMNTDSTN